MAFMDKFKEFVNPVDDDEDEDEVEEYTPAQAQPVAQPAAQPVVSESQSYYEKPKSANSGSDLSAGTKMVLFEPRSFGECEEVGQRLKEGRAVVVNLHKLDRDYSQRTIDFLTGVVYALDGKIQKVGTNVILCSPQNIGIAGTISLGSADDVDEEE
ncbi:MAG: cell division protein SepF [Firmicutes bacterium]|nr:cell division protein SepF [Bacillota bacterium]